eukprot:CAMPEP_0173185074 /NCGR_PEP_ID=MMETSP1141-20130122/9336_1 /TAXON_ID=483371 /ORGANISM="non described non described, Strain CCMP2298" /LENGTH=200 /DNA_ID=CAMNT_0014108529 /DNA_START=196 /DNA_END=799 /DNA_ORIENTATION=-
MRQLRGNPPSIRLIQPLLQVGGFHTLLVSRQVLQPVSILLEEEFFASRQQQVPVEGHESFHAFGYVVAGTDAHHTAEVVEFFRHTHHSGGYGRAGAQSQAEQHSVWSDLEYGLGGRLGVCGASEEIPFGCFEGGQVAPPIETAHEPAPVQCWLYVVLPGEVLGITEGSVVQHQHGCAVEASGVGGQTAQSKHLRPSQHPV